MGIVLQVLGFGWAAIGGYVVIAGMYRVMARVNQGWQADEAMRVFIGASVLAVAAFLIPGGVLGGFGVRMYRRDKRERLTSR